MRREYFFVLLPALCLFPVALAQNPAPKEPTPPHDFNSTVKPLLTRSCFPCHNDRNASGGVNILPFTQPSSVTEYREEWERLLRKVRTGEMPPKSFPRPEEAKVKALVDYLDHEFEKADANIKPDPGRVTARRLNRVEYTNTIRDLLHVDFRADRDFPTDDSGYGFDNIGDVLTISPILMEKYLNAAEKISARALGLEALPKKPIEVEHHSKDKQLRRLGPSLAEAAHRVEWDAEYEVVIGLPGERPDGKPVPLAFWMDGKLIHQQVVETKPSGLVYFNPYSEERFRLFLPAGDHTFRVGFLNDDYPKTLAPEDRFKDKKNKFFNMIKFVGPYPSQVAPESRKAILTCNPAQSGCPQQILSRLAHRAWRRPVSKSEVDSLARFVTLARADGQSAEEGLRVALTAMLVSPHFLFRIERDQFPNDPTRVHAITDLELASRLSYFLWSSMPDDTLLALAEQGKLHDPKTLEAQVHRLLADPKSAALAANFAGQWLETRALASVKPDPKKFPEFTPELREAMQEETRLFFEAVLKENLPVSAFLNGDFTFLNETLAKHYKIPGVTGPDFRRVSLAGNTQRGGILTHASVLTVSSYPTRTSPTIRGKYLLQNVFGAPPPPPPPDVPTLDEDAVGNAGSMRQQMEKHRTNAVCASCHQRMDTLGFALENYDGTGKWREKDGKFPVESAGTLPNGKSFTTPAELRAILAADLTEFNRCLTEKMLTYALGRGLERYDRKTVAQISSAVANDNYKFQTMIIEVVRSLPFQSRRAEVSKALPPKAAPAAAAPKEVAQK